MARSNWMLPTLRGVSIALLVLLIFMLNTIYEGDIFNIFSVFGLIGQLRDIFSFLIFIAVYYVIFGIASGVGMLFSLLGSGYFNSDHFVNLTNEIVHNVIGGWFYLPDPITGNAMVAPTVSEALAGAQAVYGLISMDLYLVILQILVAIMLFYALRASFTSNPTDSITTVTLINLVIIIPLFFNQLNNVLSIFVPTGNVGFLNNILSHDLLKDAIFVNVINLNFGEFLISPIFLVALVMFLYLEFVFQVSYIDKVTAPSIEREERLTRQIEVMKVESLKAISRIKAVEEKKREKKLLKQASMTPEEMEIEKEKKKRLSLRTMMSEKGQAGFSFISELIEKKKLEKEEERMMEAMKDTRKVSNYLEKLFKQDPEAKNTLTAKTSAPSSTRLIVSTFISLGSRIFLIILLTWACVHPFAIYSVISPDSIASSVELQTYEAVLSILIPFLLVIPFISTIIKISKHAKLEEILRLEEIRRSGLTEEELKELQAKRAKAATQETQLARDQDAAADQAKKAAQNAPTGQNP
nr:hypothetical protein [Candidatus Prometheoarchaeum syntrophicum]QEE16217.1 hypothetical protein DSAG12_02047 [Candidatus Prometheoarchaeum syntrophicum]